MKELAPHQQRVIQEKQELDERLAKLSTFISKPDFTKIVNDADEVVRLIYQEEIMRDYSKVLGKRITAFK